MKRVTLILALCGLAVTACGGGGTSPSSTSVAIDPMESDARLKCFNFVSADAGRPLPGATYSRTGDHGRIVGRYKPNISNFEVDYEYRCTFDIGTYEVTNVQLDFDW